MSIEAYYIPEPPKNGPIEYEAPEPCKCETKRLVRYTQTNAVVVYKYQCETCGGCSNAVKKSTIPWDSVRDAGEYDPELGKRWSEDYWTRRNEARERASNHQSNKWWVWYNDYLRSPVWARRREMVLRRAGGKCESCWVAPATDVHHETYQRVGREPLFDLRAVCRPCHEQITTASRGLSV